MAGREQQIAANFGHEPFSLLVFVLHVVPTFYVWLPRVFADAFLIAILQYVYLKDALGPGSESRLKMPQRTPSPAESEISVGSPSPPPPMMRSLSMKRLRLLRSPAPKSSPARIKSFSIADILGRGRDEEPPTDTATSAAAQPPGVPAPALVSAPVPAAPPAALHPFLSPALLHSYEQRLAWDYQRQLQEHFHAQAQAHLLRQMSHLNPALIIASEDGSSERSQHSSSSSSSHGSIDCCSPPSQAEKISAPEADSQGVSKKKSEEAPAVKSGEPPAGDTPLDALFQLSTKNFDEEQDPATLNIFATRSNPKKKRKSRTAFTNQQIFELEKRFLYQKYLSPADRDEIAGGLGLSNAQVITWFQNRRAKLKRDMEELKKDVQSVKLSANNSFLENVNDLSILKTRPVSRSQSLAPPTDA